MIHKWNCWYLLLHRNENRSRLFSAIFLSHSQNKCFFSLQIHLKIDQSILNSFVYIWFVWLFVFCLLSETQLNFFRELSNELCCFFLVMIHALSHLKITKQTHATHWGTLINVHMIFFVKGIVFFFYRKNKTVSRFFSLFQRTHLHMETDTNRQKLQHTNTIRMRSDCLWYGWFH